MIGVIWLSCSSNVHLCNNQKSLVIPTFLMKTRNKEEMRKPWHWPSNYNKDWHWQSCWIQWTWNRRLSGTGQCANNHIPTRATCIKGNQNCCYGTEYQSVDPCCEGLTTKRVATCVDYQYVGYTMTNQTPRILYDEPPRIRWQMGLYFDRKQQKLIQRWQRWRTQFGGGKQG